MEEKIIAVSKTKLIFLLLGALLFVAIGCWMVLFQSGVLTMLVGVICAGFFGVCALFSVRKLLDSSPGLIVNADGITDNSSAMAVGLIPWSDITDIAEYEIQKQKMVSVKLRNAPEYAVKANRLMQIVNSANIKMSGTPVNISANSLRIKHTELASLLRDYFIASRTTI